MSSHGDAGEGGSSGVSQRTTMELTTADAHRQQRHHPLERLHGHKAAVGLTRRCGVGEKREYQS